MGYIKKLKNNELVGGTDKHTIYPVTSTKAVFEEITNGNESSFKSQKTINKEQQDELDAHNGRVTYLEDHAVKSVTINGGTKTYTVDNAGNVNLDVYTTESAEGQATLAEEVGDIRSIVGTKDSPASDTLVNRVGELETLVGGSGQGSVNTRIANAKAEILGDAAEDYNTLGKVEDKIQEEVARATAEETELSIYVHAIEGGNIRVKTSTPTNPDTGAPANTVYRVAGTTTYSDYMWNGTTMVKMAEYNVDTLESQFGYYKWETASNTISITTSNQVAGSPIGSYVLTSGGSFKIKMTNKATGACTLNMNGTGAKTLLYNGDPVASNNTWENDEVISVYYDGTNYQASNSQGGSNRKIDAYLLGDLRTLALGQTYKENEAVKTIDKQLLRATKEVKTMNVTDTVAIGDLKAFDNNTYQYQGQQPIALYDGTETEGLYAIGRPAGADIAVTVDDEAIALLEETEVITVSIAGIDLTVPVNSGSSNLTIAADIAYLFGTRPEWTLTDNLDGTLTLKSKVGKAAAPTVTSDTGDTGVTIGIVTGSSYAGSVVLSKYVGGVWSNVSLGNYLADTSIWTTLTLEDLLAYTVQNTVDKDIDAATVIQGEEFFKLSNYDVKSSNKTNSIPSKTSTYIQSTVGVASKGTNLVVGPINGLIAGEEYIMEFDYIQTMTVPRDVVIVFCTGTVNNNDNFNVSSSSPRTGFFNDSNGHISIRFIYPTTAHKHIRFEYITGAVGKYLRISNISIRKPDKTAIEAIPKAFEAYDVSKSNYDAIHDVQQSTVRTEGYEYFGGASSPSITTRLRVLYKCNPHCRVTLSYSASTVSGVCSLMRDYNTSTGSITSDNELDYFVINSGNTYTKEWENSQAKYILLNLYNSGNTNINLTTAQVNAVRNSLNCVIEDVEGHDGLDKRVTDLENKEESESAVNINMIFGTNVKDCGALGDGVADDTNALQTALNKRGTIYIPNGTYLITNSLAMRSNTHIIMDKGTVIRRNVDAVFCIFYSYYTASTTAYNGEHDITIEGGTLDLGTGYSNGGCGLGFQHCQNITIRDVTFKHTNKTYHCIDCGGSKNVRVENCIFTEHLTNGTSAEMVQIDRTASGSFPIPQTYNDNSPCYDDTGCENVEICGCKFYVNKWSPAIGNHSQNAIHQHIDIHDNFIFGIGSSADEDYRGAIAFSNNPQHPNNTSYVYIHDNIIKNFVKGFQFAPDKLFWVKNNVFIDVVTKQGDSDHGIFTDNIEITTT